MATQLFDVIGLGFGPANLAIAAALTEKWAESNGSGPALLRNVLFIEKYSEFLWHPGMLIPGSRMQISYLKDLATLRNPTSSYTFLNYLHSQNRLVPFINLGAPIPTRKEFADYLAWAAREVQKRGIQVAYSEEVVSIAKVDGEDGSTDLFEVISRSVETQEIFKRQAKHLIVSAGGSPNYPHVLKPLLAPSRKPADATVPIMHTAAYITSVVPHVQKLATMSRPLKIAIIGSGQSAAEALLDLHRRLELFPTSDGSPHELHILIRKGSMKPSDDSPFVNEIFDPATTDKMYNLPSTRLRNTVRAEYINTNYSVVNQRTLDQVYEVMYEQQLNDAIAVHAIKKPESLPPRVTIHTYQTIVSASIADRQLENSDLDANSGAGFPTVTLTTQNSITREFTNATYDLVICGTGYERHSAWRLLRSSNLAKHFGLAPQDGVMRERDLDAPIRVVSEGGEPHDEQIRFNLFSGRAGMNSAVHDGGSSSPHPDLHPVETPLRESASTSRTDSSPSSPSTPLTSPTHSTAGPPPVYARISRTYRLLPCDQDGCASREGKPWNGRIYLQGCSEATHGLSDTLLSVLGVRAAEVVGDIWDAEASPVETF